MSTNTVRSNTVSPLRQRMIEDMKARKLGAQSQKSHIDAQKPKSSKRAQRARFCLASEQPRTQRADFPPPCGFTIGMIECESHIEEGTTLRPCVFGLH